MKFGIFYEHQLPRPWHDGDEQQLYDEALDQVELADELGIDYVWEVEHHFLEEYSHSSAPEVFLAAAAQRTEDIRLGHGIKLMPQEYNRTFRAAEQVATLDLVSNGRVEWGTGESGSQIELGGSGTVLEEKYDMWREGVEQAANMMTMEPYPGYDGDYVEMPARNVVPKPVQDPHPPLWMACSSREMIEVAAQHGLGALCFAFTTPAEAEEWVDTYYEAFEEDCVPLGHEVNPNVAMVTGFSCHEDRDEAVRRGEEGFAFFQFALAYYYVFGSHKPGAENIWEEFQAIGGADAEMLDGAGEEDDDFLSGVAIGTPEELRATLRGYEEAGVDQIIFVQQGGNNEHEHICDSLELFAEEVMPEFHERDPDHVAEKERELEEYVEAAMERKEFMEPADEAELPEVEPYDRDVNQYE